MFKRILAGLSMVLMLSGCGIGQMRDDLADLREYQQAHGQMVEQQQRNTRNQDIHQASQAAQRRLDQAIKD